MTFFTRLQNIHPDILKKVVYCQVIVIVGALSLYPFVFTEKAEGQVCTQPLYACPSSITVWGGVTASFYKYGNGTLPNGHAYCGYYADVTAPGANGDRFAGAFDRVLGRQITFARKVSCVDTSYTDPDTGAVTVSYSCTRVGGYVDVNPINQGAKCLTLTYPDPEAASLGVGTDSNFFVEADCTWSYDSWFAYDPAAGGGICRGGANPAPCYPWSVSPTNSPEPPAVCTPAEPTFSAACAYQTATNTFKVTLSWAGVSGAVNYPVRLQGPSHATGDSPSYPIGLSGTTDVVGWGTVGDAPTASGFAFTGMTAPGNYSYWGHAWNSNGWSTNTVRTVSCPATCTYNSTLAWGTGCSATVNTTVGSGNSTTITNTASGYTGSTVYSCSNGTWTQTSSSCSATVSLPTVTTAAVSGITQSSASSGGTIVSNGGATITVSGITWSTSLNPTTALATKTTDGWAAGGPWPDTMSGLAAGTTYHVRAYATNSAGTAYGADVSFTTTASTACSATTIGNCSLSATASGGTSGSCSSGYTGSCSYTCTNTVWSQNSNSCTPLPTAPSVSTAAATSVTQTSALSGGTINSNGGAAITVSGIVWGAAANPTTALATKTTDGATTNTSWSDSITGLTAGTTYHVRAYATNSIGTAYGSDVSFTTVALGSCAATTAGNCSLSATPSGGTSGSCSSGYTGACSYTCTNGVWNQNSNSCILATTASLSVSPNPTAYNSRPTITWGSSNATSCTAGGPWSNAGTLSGSGLTDPLTANTTFTFQCSGPGGTSPLQSVTVNVNAASSCTLPWGGTLASGGSVTAYNATSVVSPDTCLAHSETRTCSNGTLSGSYTNQSCTTPIIPTATLTANPTSVYPGQTSKLTWTSTNATSCTAAGGFLTGGATSGNKNVNPSTTSTYSITCANANGTSAPAQATVTVLLPVLTISTAPNRVAKGSSTTVTWNATSVKNCAITRNGVAWKSGSSNGAKVYAGSISDTITAQTKYVMSCTDVTGAAFPTTATAIVNLVAGFQEF